MMQHIKYLIFTILFFSISLTAFPQGSRVLTKEIRLYEDAVDLYLKEKYGSAQKLFDKITEQSPDKYSSEVSDAYFYAGVCAVQLYNKDAIERIELFLKKFPQHSKAESARFYLGKYFYNQKDTEKALTIFKTINKEALPENASDEYHFKIGYCYLQSDKVKEAKNHFVQVLNADSKYSSPAQYYYAHILYEEKNYVPALKYFEELKQDKTFSPIVPFYIAQIYYLQNRHDELSALAPTLLESAPNKRKKEINRMLGQILYEKGMYTEALSYLQEAIEDNELATDTDLYELAFCYFKTANYKKTLFLLSTIQTGDELLLQNAQFLSGNCYLQSGMKSEAGAAFLVAAESKGDPDIAEEALFLYAMIIYELPNNAFNESIKAFQKYLSIYPNNKYTDKANEILATLFFSTRNYQDALILIEKVKNRTNSIKEAHQRICFNRGIELFNEQKQDSSISLFRKAIEIDQSDDITANSYYMIGEASYRGQKYKEATEYLQKFFNSFGSKNSYFYQQACYTYGYTYLRLKEYNKASLSFLRFFSSNKKTTDPKIVADIYNRLGDCYFMQKQFNLAIEQYTKNIQEKNIDADYATYQKALSYGALGNYKKKIDILLTLLTDFPESIYLGSANLEIGNTYLLIDETKLAYKYFHVVTENFKNSTFTKEAMLKKGTILYTESRDEEALRILDEVVSQFQGTEEAKDALMTIKNIYITQNRVDEYFNYVKKIPQAQISTSEKDSITYLAAENRYLEGDCIGAVKGLKNYLESFPMGTYELYANFYIADCMQKEGKALDALPYYENIIKKPKSIFYERSLANLANGYYSLGDFEKAKFYYVILNQNYETKSNLTLSALGEMRCLYKLQDYNEAINSALDLLKLEKVSSEVTDEANFITARSFYIMNDSVKAQTAYQKLENSKNREYAGEAGFRKAEFLFRSNHLNESEKIISNITTHPTSEYWLAKSFILWAKIYYSKGNILQAKQTLQSIIDNYDGADLVEESQMLYRQIEEKEVKSKNEKEQKQEELRKQQETTIQLDEDAN